MKITKLLSVALVAAVLGLAACSKSSDNNDASQITLVTASTSFAADVSIFPVALGSTTSNTNNPYVGLAQNQFGAAVAGSGSFQFATIFGMVPTLVGFNAGTPISEISSSAIVNYGLLPTITGAGKPYTAFFTVDLTENLQIHSQSGGDSTLSVAAQVYQSGDSYLLEVLLPTDGTKTSSSWVALLAASEKKDQSEGSLVGFTSSFTTPATSFSWTRSSDNTTVTYDATVATSNGSIKFSTSGISLTTAVTKNILGLYTVQSGELKVPAAVAVALGGGDPSSLPSNTPNIDIKWNADGTGSWTDGGKVATGGQGETSGTF